MTNIATLTQLRKARALLAKGWTQEAFARDINGERIFSGAKEGIASYCVVGALQQVEAGDGAYDALYRYMCPGVSLALWNDTIGRTQGEVLTLFDKVITKLEAWGGWYGS